MFLGFVCPLLMILDGLMVWRLRRNSVVEELPAQTRQRREQVVGALAVLLAEFPLFLLMPSFIPEKLWGDAETHARVGRDIALYGLETGWLDGLLAGFPFAQHYPPLPWLTLALEISVGVSPVRAIQWLGWLFLAVTPLVVYACLVQIPRVSVAFAAIGAIFFAWISPYNEFFGGYEVFFSCGLISQTMGLPFVLLWMRSVVRRDGTQRIFLWAALAMASHPQLSVAGILFLGLGLAALGRPSLFKTYLWASAVMVALAVAIYGQGVFTLRVPFGWPESFGWRHIGFPASRLAWWLEDGDLFDQRASGVLTGLTIVMVLVSLPRLKESALRAAVFAFALGLLLSVSGPSLPKLGGVGVFALKFIQPLRFVALLPPAAALLVTLGLAAVVRDLVRLTREFAPAVRSRWIESAFGLAVLGLLSFAFPARLHFAVGWRQMLTNFETPAGYEVARVREWVARPKPGRLWYDTDDTEMTKLFSYDFLSLQTTRLMASTAAVGGHVGVLLAASPRLEPKRAGSERRAEALGVRHLLFSGEELPSGWHAIERHGTMSFLERDGATDLIGVGCVGRRFSGSNAALARRLYSDLRDNQATDRLLDPEHLTELEWTQGDVRETEVPIGDCAFSDARVRVSSGSPGRYLATVESSRPVDVVVRAAYFPSWAASVDGKPVRVRVVAPGFFSVRVPEGRHEVRADAAVWTKMGSSLGLSALALGALALGRSDSARARLRSRFGSRLARVSTRPSV